VGDAEAHAEEDKKFRELVGARNKADATIHTVEKALKEVGDKISDEEKTAASDAVTAVKTAMSGDDREDIEAKTQTLEQASAALLQKMYQQSAGGAGGLTKGCLIGMFAQELSFTNPELRSASWNEFARMVLAGNYISAVLTFNVQLLGGGTEISDPLRWVEVET